MPQPLSGLRNDGDGGIVRCGGDEGREQDEGCFAPAGATFFRSAAKEGKDAPGEPFHKGSPGPLLTAKGLRPIGSPAGVYGRTRDEGREAWTGVTDCHTRCAGSQ